MMHRFTAQYKKSTSVLLRIFLMTTFSSLSGCDDCIREDLPFIRDMYIVENTKTSDNTSNRPYLTLPPGLAIRPSSIPNGGLGVWTTRYFPMNTRFGPYGGIVVDDVDDWEYTWQIYDETFELKHYVDGIYKNSSNWLRYINAARSVDEENMFTYQYNDEVYYVTYECIKPETELLTWYGEDYGTSLGLNRTIKDYQRRFKINESKYIVENSVTEKITRMLEKCYKFYEGQPFDKPPGSLKLHDKYCIYDGNYQVCRYRECEENPCSKKIDCLKCQGYCLHCGKYIKQEEQFTHVDKTNTCICQDDGHFGCSIRHQYIDDLCS